MPVFSPTRTSSVNRTVRILNHRMEQIAFHVKHEPDRCSTQSRHIVPEKRGGIEKEAAFLLNKAGLIGVATGQWAEQMIRQRGVEGMRVLMVLLNLAQRHLPGCLRHVEQQGGLRRVVGYLQHAKQGMIVISEMKVIDRHAQAPIDPCISN